MTQTRFEDGTGLNSHNVASPKDLVAMVKTANTYPLIRRFSTTGGHAVAIKDSIQQFNPQNQQADEKFRVIVRQMQLSFVGANRHDLR